MKIDRARRTGTVSVDSAHGSLWRLAAVVGLTLAAALPALAQVPVTTVAREGGQAPGAPAGITFDSFAIPIINDGGLVAFEATLTGPGVGSANNNGIWAGAPGALQLVAREGDPAPGAAAGEVFAGLFVSTINSSGQVAFKGTLAGAGVTPSNDEALWVGVPGALQLAVREGDTAPGAPSGVVFGPLFGGPVLGESGELAFFAELAGAGVTGANDRGLWVGPPGALVLVAREGDPAVGAPAGAVYSITSTRGVAVNGLGQVAFTVNVFGGGATGRGIWAGSPGSPSLVVRDGDPAPGTPAGVVFSGIRAARLNDSGELAFGSFLNGPGVDPTNHAGLWAGAPGGLQLVIREGDPAPGAGGGDTVDLGTFPGLAALADSGKVTTAPGTRLAGPGVSSANDQVVFFGPAGGLALVAREGDPAPGVGGGVVLADLTRRDANDSDQVLYIADLAGGAASPGDNGLWLWTQGVTVLLVRSGETVEIAPGEIVTLGGIRLITQGSLNDSGQVVFGAGIPQSSEEAIFILSPAGVPTADAGPDQTVDENDLVTLDGSASSDPQGDPLAFGWAQLAGPTVSLDLTDPAHPTFTAPPVAANLTLTFELEVSDGSDTSDPDTVDVTVVSVNNPPVADAGDDSTIKEGATAQLDGTASYDPEGDSIHFDWVQAAGPPVSLTPSGLVAEPTFVAPLGVGQVLIFKLRVNDGFETSVPSAGTDSSLEDTVAVSVVENSAPSADAGSDQTRDEAATVILAGSGSDPDLGDMLSFQWTQTGGPFVLLDDDTSASASFVAPAVGPGGEAFRFALVVTDDDPVNPRSSAPDEVVITVRNINDPPSCELAAAVPDRLWPPNHKLLPVEIAGVMDADAVYNDITVQITAVTQDEPVDGSGDGDSSPDAVIQAAVPSDGVLIRAERSGSGDGRVYEVGFVASDGFETCTGSVRIGVPKSRKSTPVDSGQVHDSTSP